MARSLARTWDLSLLLNCTINTTAASTSDLSNGQTYAASCDVTANVIQTTWDCLLIIDRCLSFDSVAEKVIYSIAFEKNANTDRWTGATYC